MRKLFVLMMLASLALAVGCGSSSSGSTPVGVPTGGGGGTSNTLALAVDGGPDTSQFLYQNGVFATVTVCSPGSTSNCVNVDHVLVDTGSFGLRVLQSEVASLNLQPIGVSGGQLNDCVQFGDGSFLWGPVVNSQVTLAGETANNVPIHVISSSTTGIPSGCSGTNENTQQLLGANGILGVGLEPFDCGGACDSTSGGIPSGDPYYSCSGSSCTPTFASCGSLCNDSTSIQQVTNPVALFSVDNNGVIVELPSVSGSAATTTGSLIIGIGTESNNQLNANVYITACDNIDTTFEGTSFSVDAANCTPGVNGGFLDTGSNALYFFDANNVLPVCPANPSNPGITSFYCPSSLMSLSAVNTDFNSPPFTNTVNFSVDNAANLFASPNAALSTLAGPTGAVSDGFDWGLPFFYGKNVYVAIDGASMPSNLPNGPWWAY